MDATEITFELRVRFSVRQNPAIPAHSQTARAGPIPHANDLSAPIARSHQAIELLQKQLAQANMTAAAATAATNLAARAAAKAAAKVVEIDQGDLDTPGRNGKASQCMEQPGREIVPATPAISADLASGLQANPARAREPGTADTNSPSTSMASGQSLMIGFQDFVSRPTTWMLTTADSDRPGSGPAASSAGSSAPTTAAGREPSSRDGENAAAGLGGGSGIFSVVMAARMLARAKKHIAFWSPENQGSCWPSGPPLLEGSTASSLLFLRFSSFIVVA